MTYELALKLKNAGFPQTGSGGYMNSDETAQTGLEDSWGNGVVSCPTLSELIGACGDGFVSVYRGNDEWRINDEGGSEIPQIQGETLEIAVANLYLALQTNKDENL